ncbi:PH domain-containing protein [Kitasatospora sp. McL0602]|uniref:PH domain-containing protein n=1 Tax=Kitasatospora sp. McL0602 TaxID=3439530 RepID=UPI003F896AEC
MTESDGKPDPGSAASEPKYADRVYRSVPGVISGALLLVVAGWLIIDAALTGTGRVPWIALAAVPVFVPPIVAYTIRPVVYSNSSRLLVRNPLRTVKAPWSSVEGLKSGYSVELFAGGKSYQVWAVPVSMRQRKRANRVKVRAAAAGDPSTATPGVLTPTRRPVRAGESNPTRAWSDQVVDTLRETAELNAANPAAVGEVSVRWCWWIIAPTLLGLVAFITLIAVS